MAARGLGKGLDSLIPSSLGVSKKAPTAAGKAEAAKEIEGNVSMVKITKVEPNREQPRKTFEEEPLQQLADSIKKMGILEPILVIDKKDHYEIVAGERRWRAAKLAGLKEVPVIIRDLTYQQQVEIALIENLQREDLNPIEEALAYKRLIEEFNLKQEEVAERVSKSRTAITNFLRLLKLCDEVQKMVIAGELSTGQARAIITIEDMEQQLQIARTIVKENLSVREVEKLIKTLSQPKKEKVSKAKNEELEHIYEEIAEKMKRTLGTKVSIVSKENGAGKIEIDFFSNEDFDRVTELIMKA